MAEVLIVLVVVVIVAVVQVRRRGSRLQRPDNAPGRRASDPDTPR